MKSIANRIKTVVRSEDGWDRLVFAEVLVPDVPNVFNDYWTKDAIRRAAYMFMMRGFGIDVEHDNVDIMGGGAYVIESFIARPGDPDFIEGSWVVGMHITDDTLWQDVLDGKINGFSYEASVEFFSAVLEVTDDGVRTGVTEPDPFDGHTHHFMVLVDETNRPVSGGTSEELGHSHTISTHTVTDETDDHVHRYNLVQGKDNK